MSEAMERPKSVEVGQRWEAGRMYGNEPGIVAVVTFVDGERVKYRYEDHPKLHRECRGELMRPRSSFVGCVGRYLGGPSQPQVAAGQRRRSKTYGHVFVVEEHPRVPGQFQRRKDNGDCGGVPFTAEELERESDLLTDVAADPAPVAPPSPPRYNLAAGAELRYSNGHPRTALEAMQARKPPEPWRPSCDELHWLPDAPGVVRS